MRNALELPRTGKGRRRFPRSNGFTVVLLLAASLLIFKRSIANLVDTNR